MRNNRWRMVLFIAVVIGGLVSLYAASSPDGLEKIAQMQGFFGNEKHFATSLMPSYKISEIHAKNISKSLAGIIGTCAVFGLLFIIGKLLYGLNLHDDKK